MKGHRTRSLVASVVVAALVVPGPLSAASGTSASRLATETLAAISGLAPQDFGAATVNGLEYADPKEGLSIVDAPVPNSDGSVELAYRSRFRPAMASPRSSSCSTGRAATTAGWASGGTCPSAKSPIDTTFGAPHFVRRRRERVVPARRRPAGPERQRRRRGGRATGRRRPQRLQPPGRDGVRGDHPPPGRRLAGPPTTSGRCAQRTARSAGTAARPTAAAPYRPRGARSTRAPWSATRPATSSSGCCRRSATSAST